MVHFGVENGSALIYTVIIMLRCKYLIHVFFIVEAVAMTGRRFGSRVRRYSGAALMMFFLCCSRHCDALSHLLCRVT